MKQLAMRTAITFALAAFLAAVLTVSGVQAQTVEVVNPPVKVAAKKKVPKNKTASHGAKAKFLPGSQETVSQRSARLKRECYGATNAGACSGYTR